MYVYIVLTCERVSVVYLNGAALWFGDGVKEENLPSTCSFGFPTRRVG